MKMGGGSESTIIIGPSKSVLVYVLHSLEYVLGLARFRVFVRKLLLLRISYKLQRLRGKLVSNKIMFIRYSEKGAICYFVFKFHSFN